MNSLKKIGLFFIFYTLFYPFSFASSISNIKTLQESHYGNSFVISCLKSSSKCNFYAKNNLGLERTEKISLILDRTRIMWHSKSLLELRVHLGTNDDTSFFFDFNKLLLTKKGFENVIVIDDKNLIVAYPSHHELFIAYLFRDVEPLHIKRDFYSSPEMSIDEKKSHFLPDGNLFLSYSEKANNKNGYIDRDEIIKAP